MATVVKKVPYNKAGYVPGGSSPAVAKAIQALAIQDPGKNPAMKLVTQVVRPTSTQTVSGGIETPAQIEARVRKLADEQYARQKASLDEETARLKREAEGRRLAMTAAYQAAGEQNAKLGAGIQTGWTNAANTLSGLAAATTGGIADTLSQELATEEAKLARVGAAGTGFDARSQAGVEQYRGGTLPAELFTRLGGIANQDFIQQGINFGNRGVAESLAAEGVTRDKIQADRFKALAELEAGRADVESALRKQFYEGRADQLEAKAKADEALIKVRSDMAKLKNQYMIARMQAQTAADKLAVDKIYKETMAGYKRDEIAALNAQRYAAAGLSTAKANDIIANPGGTTKKTPSVSQVSGVIGDADKAGTGALRTALDNIWEKTPGATQPSTWTKAQGNYAGSPDFATAQKWYHDQLQKSFGTLMMRVMKAITKPLKTLKYTQDQIRREAFRIVSAEVDPPQWWLKQNPSYAPKITTKA